MWLQLLWLANWNSNLEMWKFRRNLKKNRKHWKFGKSLTFDLNRMFARFGCFDVTAMLSWGWLKLRLIEGEVDWSWGWLKLKLIEVEVDQSWGWMKLRLIEIEVDWDEVD